MQARSVAATGARPIEAENLRVIFMGSPEFAVPSLEALAGAGYDLVAVYTQPDRPAGRGRRLVAPPVKQAARARGIPVLQPERLRGTTETTALRLLAPDLVVVAAYGQILRPAVLELPRFGCLNVHASLLPRHRGASAIAAAILAGDPVTGASIMRIDAGMDTGPVLSRQEIAISDEDTTGTLTERLATVGAALLIETLPGYLDGSVAAVPQDNRAATSAPILRKDAGIVDWHKPADALAREVRAYNPWPLSSTTLSGETVQILEAVPLTASTAGQTALPGAVVELGSLAHSLTQAHQRRAAFAVQTGSGLLVPLTLRRAGKNAVSGAEFARGLRGILGQRFGSVAAVQ